MNDFMDKFRYGIGYGKLNCHGRGCGAALGIGLLNGAGHGDFDDLIADGFGNDDCSGHGCDECDNSGCGYGGGTIGLPKENIDFKPETGKGFG